MFGHELLVKENRQRGGKERGESQEADVDNAHHLERRKALSRLSEKQEQSY